MNVRNFFGLMIIASVILGLGAFSLLQGSGGNSNSKTFADQDLTVVDGYLGWEKKGFFQDEEVKKIFAEDYQLDVKIEKKGSVAMVLEPSGDKDYIFPSNKIATEIYKSRTGTDSETIFFSPIVVFSWSSLISDLEAAGLVSIRDGVHFLNMPRAIELIEQDATWESVGGTQLRGRISLTSTNPSQSSSGNLFSALVLSTMTNQTTPDTADFTPEIANRVSGFYDKMGLLESSSGDIFEKMLTLGRATYPMVVGYESQLIEVINEDRPGVEKVVPLYPDFTVWAEHGFVGLSSEGERLEEALLENDELGKIAWETYGLRKIGEESNTSQYLANGIAPRVDSVRPLPNIDVMEKIIEVI